MSIAIAAVVRPSRILRLAQAAMCALVLAAGVTLKSPLLLACACAGLGWQAREVKPWRVDISAVGQVRLTVYQRSGPAPARPVRLLPGALLWPGLMLLGLEDEDGRRYRLLLLPDSVAAPAWRALALALRALAA